MTIPGNVLNHNIPPVKLKFALLGFREIMTSFGTSCQAIFNILHPGYVKISAQAMKKLAYIQAYDT
jgi:hypothetical protein